MFPANLDGSGSVNGDINGNEYRAEMFLGLGLSNFKVESIFSASVNIATQKWVGFKLSLKFVL